MSLFVNLVKVERDNIMDSNKRVIIDENYNVVFCNLGKI